MKDSLIKPEYNQGASNNGWDLQDMPPAPSPGMYGCRISGGTATVKTAVKYRDSKGRLRYKGSKHLKKTGLLVLKVK